MNLIASARIALPAVVLAASSAFAADIDIPFRKEVLDNGLTVIVHEDHKAPVVAVNLWYHVGSKDEPSGRSGFAHLFEHLMFNGSENNPGEFFAVVTEVFFTRGAELAADRPDLYGLLRDFYRQDPAGRVRGRTVNV